jgi:hypothetical protein
MQAWIVAILAFSVTAAACLSCAFSPAPSYEQLPPCEARTPEGPGLEELALLVVSRPTDRSVPKVLLLDWRPYVVPFGSHAGLSCNHERTRIEPGSHTLHFGWGPSTAADAKPAAASRLEFTAEPGHTYALVVEKRLFSGYLCELVDETTGGVVAAFPPPQALRAEPDLECGASASHVMWQVCGVYASCGDPACSERVAGAPIPTSLCREPWFEVSTPEARPADSPGAPPDGRGVQ